VWVEVTMRVSVIIPCYKDAGTLARALDSILGQSRKVDEIIVVNDASPESREINVVMESYPQVRYIINPQNMGLAASRNVGVAQATGDVISFLDADDELHPQKIQLQLALYQPDSVISCSTARITEEKGRGRVDSYFGNLKFFVVRDSSKLIRRNNLTGASMMISRVLFLSLGGYDVELRSCEDFDLWLRLLDAGVPVVNIEFPLYFYWVNTEGLSRNFFNISYWEMEAVQKHFARCRQRGDLIKGESMTIFIWLFKHFVRYEQCCDPKILNLTRQNMVLLKGAPLLKILLLFVHQLGLTWLVARIRSNRQELRFARNG
jgi:glycosyltransferase involved in cell wall biosynthesis